MDLKLFRQTCFTVGTSQMDTPHLLRRFYIWQGIPEFKKDFLNLILESKTFQKISNKSEKEKAKLIRIHNELLKLRAQNIIVITLHQYRILLCEAHNIPYDETLSLDFINVDSITKSLIKLVCGSSILSLFHWCVDIHIVTCQVHPALVKRVQCTVRSSF